MSSSLFARVKRKSRAEGMAKGLTKGARGMCLAIVGRDKPASLALVAPAIEACSDVGLLQKWALAVSRLPEAEFVALVRADASESERPAAVRTAVRGHAPRPARRSRPSKRR